MEIISRNHEILPVRDSARTEDGRVGSLLKVFDYPLTAICADCGGKIRCKSMLMADWEHVEET